MMATGTALLLAAVAFTANDLLTLRRTASNDLQILAEITSANSAAAVLFRDPKAVHETLGFLEGHPHIQFAAVTGKTGSLLGYYLRSGLEPHRLDYDLQPDHVHHESVFSGHLHVVRPIIQDGEFLGEVYLRSDLIPRLLDRLTAYLGIAGAVMVLALLSAFAVGGLMQRTVTDPLLALTETAGQISREKNYELRAEPAGRDEIGRLIASFNEMLGEIQTRDDELRHHRERLEEVVAERTHELEAANNRLRQAKNSAEDAAEKMTRQAYHDALTGLPNRLLINDRLSAAISTARNEGHRLALLFLDLDRFKVINDSLGHAVGDQLLVEIGRRLTRCVRSEDTVARFGGDEFMVLLRSVSAPEDAGRVARKILDILAEPLDCHGHELYITTSVGITIYPDDGDDNTELMRNADVSMYRAKEKGRNDFQYWTPEMDDSSHRRLSLENRLRKALEREELELHYQPKLDLASGRVIGAEALLRWQHEDLGAVSPAQFVPLAEETGLIIPLGEWVMAEACRQIRAWRRSGYPWMTIAVNLSACQFRRGHMPEMVFAALRDADLEGEALDLEITESVFIHGTETARTALEALRREGVSFSIDDFGTGYSSLSYLQRFPVDAVKIDRSFVANLPAAESDASIATTIIAMAHSLKLTVVAEGVETPEQAEFLKAQGCDQVQGYLYGRPMPAGELLTLLEQQSADRVARL
jgi:diguanylate cyclase (GGDEF)-like protein